MALLILLIQLILGASVPLFYFNGLMIPFYIVGVIAFLFVIFYAAVNGRLYGFWNYPIIAGLFVVVALYFSFYYDIFLFHLMLLTSGVILPVYKAIFLIVYQILVRRKKVEDAKNNLNR